VSAQQTLSAAERDERIGRLYRERPRSRFLRASALALGALALYSFVTRDIAWRDLLSARRQANLERFLHRDAIPYPLRETGFTWTGLGEWASELMRGQGYHAMLATLWISVLAIVLAGAAASLLAPLGAHTLMDAQPFGNGGARGRTWPWRALVGGTRLLSVLLRAVPEYVWAFLLLAMLGSSAWPAVLALAIHNSGILARLGSETIENLAPAPLESLAGAGAGRRQLAALVAFPLALPRYLLYFFYRFETCVREATVLGMLGVVSLGYWIADARGRQHYDEMLLFVAAGAVLVIVGDAVSMIARRWIR
jgi:phosphonate transport system permease protein